MSNTVKSAISTMTSENSDNMETKTFFNKIFKFFNNKWTKRGFSIISVGYVVFLTWLAWMTFAYHFVYENAVAIFLVYSFINVMFATVMIYTRRNIVTKLCVLVLHPIILFMMVYGFGEWYLLAPPFIAATIIFLVSGMIESLKVILGTIYMILFVLSILAYVTLASLTIDIPYKMDLSIRESPNVAYHRNYKANPEDASFRLVAYVDTERQNPTVNFYIEQTELDRKMWNVTAERVFGGVRAGTTSYKREYKGEPTIIWDIPRTIEWQSPDVLRLDGKIIEIDSEGQIVAGDLLPDETDTMPHVTVKPIPETGAEPSDN